MQLNDILKWMPEELIKAFCRTLVGSLWIGIFAAAVAAVILLTTRYSKPALRYFLFTLLFFTQLLLTGFYFYKQCSLTGEASGSYFPSPAAIPSPQQLFQLNPKTYELSPATALASLSDRYAYYIVLGWLIVFLVRMIAVYKGISTAYRIRSQHVYEPSRQWEKRFTELVRQMGLKRIKLLESGMIPSPVTVGYLKATILLPLGMLANLPPSQVEAIILHELAHIRRRDYLVNMIQSFSESILFFNPAILWISRLMREEREACCDEIAIQQTGEKETYLNALVSFHEYVLSAGPFALAYIGKKNAVLNRVKRIVFSRNPGPGLLENLLIFCGLIVLLSFSYTGNEKIVSEAPLSDNTSVRQPVVANINSSPSVSYTIPVKKSSIGDKRNPGIEGSARTTVQTAKYPKLRIDSIPKSKLTVTPTLQASWQNDADRIRGVIKDLIDKGIVKSSAEVDWFGIDEKQMMINGKTLSSSLHAELKTRYGIEKSYGLYFGPSAMHGTGIYYDKADIAGL